MPAGTQQCSRMTPKQVADALGVRVDLLTKWRRKRVGPPYTRLIGRIYYSRADIDEWLRQKRVES
jgi:DNA-binding transcriptional MerR regulator